MWLYWRGLPQSADDAFLLASKAYEVLSDEKLRNAHDAHLEECRLQQKSDTAARRQARQRYLEATRSWGARGICALCAESVDGLALRSPWFAAGPLRFTARTFDAVAMWFEQHGSLSSLPFAIMFVIFVAVAAGPMLASVLVFLVRWLWAAFGLSRRTDRKKKAEGLRRARDRQIEKHEKATSVNSRAEKRIPRRRFSEVGLRDPNR